MIKITRREALGRICGLAGLSIISGCAVNPVTGKRQFMLMSEDQEIALGRDAHQDILNAYGKYNDDTIQSWFDEKGQQMAEVTHRSDLNFTFTVLDSPVVNAFAVPGGYVYVTRGILGYFNNEAQFAGVLGHELGHVNARHTASLYSKAQLVSFSLGIGSIFSEEFRKYAQFANLGMSLLFLKFSRDDERQADSLGVEYSSLTGYDAVEMSGFFSTLERMKPAGGSLPGWASTHPDPGDRVAATKKAAMQFQNANSDKEFAVKRNEYMDIIDGVIYGDDPKQGYVKDGMFYHPEMRFMFPVPGGWDLSNSPSEVRMSPESQDAVLIFAIAQGAEPQDAANKFAYGNNISVEEEVPITVNKMDGVRLSGNMTSDGTEMALVSYFIKKDNSLFAFHGVTSPNDIRQFSRLFDNTASGFYGLTDPELLNVSPNKIVVRQTKSSKTLEKALNDFGVPEEKLEELAVMNGMELTDSIEAGTRIKIVG